VIAILVGSYDGSGNYGDIAQLDASLGMLDQLDDDLLVLPVVEQQFAATHEAMARELIHPTEHVLYFDAGGDPGGEGLALAKIPASLTRAISYLYGGGFLNPSWGERKLAMLKAAEDLVAGTGRVTRIASGQQVNRDWIDTLAPVDAEILRRFEILGGRDDASTATLAGLGARGPALNTGDDAVGVLRAIEPAQKAAQADSPLTVNVHFAEHEWVTDLPGSIRDFDLGFLTELAHLTEQRVRVRPLLAYLDPRIDERVGLEGFAAACAELGIEVAEPLVLRPTNVAEVAAELCDAALTLSSSYHVALTSLLLAIPTAILRDNDYYAQKARGLLSDFDLPPDFSPRSTDDPVLAARAIAPHLLEPELRERTRRGLGAAAARVRHRRVDAEARLLSLITQEDREAERSRHEISSVRCSEGELSFDAQLQGVAPKQIWLRTTSKVNPGADAALAIALMPAMRNGGTLEIDAPISPRVMRMQREFQGIQRAWSRDWSFEDPPLREVEVSAPLRREEGRSRTGRVAAFFSGGVDSFSTILGEEGVTDLIFVRGVSSAGRRGRTRPAAAHRRHEPARPLRSHRRHEAAGPMGGLLQQRPGSCRAFPGAVVRPGFDLDRICLREPAETWIELDGRPALGNREHGDLRRGGIARQGRANRANCHPPGRAEDAPRVLAEPGRCLQLRPLPQVPADDGNSRVDRPAEGVRDLPFRNRSRAADGHHPGGADPTPPGLLRRNAGGHPERRQPAPREGTRRGRRQR
jgi:polysaccharide pyruvyl transferase WcaK-like protein